MKQKIKVVDKIHNKVLEGEVNVPNKLHFEVQKNTRAQVFEDRKKKYKKGYRKHKRNYREEE